MDRTQRTLKALNRHFLLPSNPPSLYSSNSKPPNLCPNKHHLWIQYGWLTFCEIRLLIFFVCLMFLVHDGASPYGPSMLLCTREKFIFCVFISSTCSNHLGFRCLRCKSVQCQIAKPLMWPIRPLTYLRSFKVCQLLEPGLTQGKTPVF